MHVRWRTDGAESIGPLARHHFVTCLENSSRGKVGDLLPAGEEAAKRGREGEERARSQRRKQSRGRLRSWWRRHRGGG